MEENEIIRLGREVSALSTQIMNLRRSENRLPAHLEPQLREKEERLDALVAAQRQNRLSK